MAEKGQADVGHPKPIGHRKSRSVTGKADRSGKADRPKQKVPVRYRPIAAGQRSPHPHESAHAQGT